ncbi:MAG: NYN domain-containing protein [Alphaproteobacteria bacterium]|nr:NYN domain-containing protein [Alphaproteobacteria bacterium]
MRSYSEDKVALFIDGSNFYAATKSSGFDVDYSRLKEYFAKSERLVRAFYYTCQQEDPEYSPLRPLVDWLDYNGFKVLSKPSTEFIDSMGVKHMKDSVNIEIAVDMLQMADHVDHIVLFSGDGDFFPLMDAVQKKGVRFTVVSKTSMAADDLRRKADTFIDVAKLAKDIKRIDNLYKPNMTDMEECPSVDLQDIDMFNRYSELMENDADHD